MGRHRMILGVLCLIGAAVFVQHVAAQADEDATAIEWVEASKEDRSWTDRCLRVNLAFSGLRENGNCDDVFLLVGA